MAATIRTSLTTALQQPNLLHFQAGICTILLGRILAQPNKAIATHGVRSYSYHRPTRDIQRDLEKNRLSQYHVDQREFFTKMLDYDVDPIMGWGAVRRVKGSLEEEKSKIRKEQADLLQEEGFLVRELKEAHGGEMSRVFSRYSTSASKSSAPNVAVAVKEDKTAVVQVVSQPSETVSSTTTKQDLVIPTLASLEQDLAIREAQITQVDQEVRDISSLDSIPGSDEQSTAQKEQYRLAYEKKSKLIGEKWAIQEQIQVMQIKNGNFHGQCRDPAAEQAKARGEAAKVKDEKTKAKEEADPAVVGVFFLGCFFWLGALTMSGFWDWLFEKCHSFWSTLKRWTLIW